VTTAKPPLNAAAPATIQAAEADGSGLRFNPAFQVAWVNAETNTNTNATAVRGDLVCASYAPAGLDRKRGLAPRAGFGYLPGIGDRRVILALWLACAPTRALAPLEAHQAAVTASLGGPIVEFAGAPIPLPITSVGVIYGLDGKTNLHAAVYPTNLALFGVFGFDVGASRELVTPDGPRPRVMVDVSAYTFAGNVAEGDPKGGFRLFPDASVIVSWPIPGGAEQARTIPYVGVDNFVEVLPSPRYVPSLVFGDQLRVGKRVGLQLEGKWVAPWVDTDPLVPHWYGVRRRGAFSVQLGVVLYLGDGGAP